jgi:hypothetical protein
VAAGIVAGAGIATVLDLVAVAAQLDTAFVACAEAAGFQADIHSSGDEDDFLI